MKGNIQRKQIGIAMMEIRYMEVEKYGKSKKDWFGESEEKVKRERGRQAEKETHIQNETEREREREYER